MNESAQTGYLILFVILIALTGFSFEFWTSPEPAQIQATATPANLILPAE